MALLSLCGLSVDEVYDLIRPFGFSYSHALEISHNLYKKRFREISDFKKVSKELKNVLTKHSQTGFLEPAASQVSKDETIKYLFRSTDEKQFETVYIPDGKRHTVCVSTQSGCRMGCPFCLSGRYGFHGNLTAGEIVNQIISIPGAGKITHVVFMGMGEPMDNLENVLKACNIITARWGLALSPRNVTVSTVGINPGIELFLKRSDCNLTLSLHSPFPEERSLVVPVENKYPAMDILKLMKTSRLKKGRRLTLAYVMIKGLNDTDRHLNELISLLKGSSVRINILPYHSADCDTMTPSSQEKMQFFKHNLIISGISASIRKSRGEDISAACGLLAAGFEMPG